MKNVLLCIVIVFSINYPLFAQTAIARLPVGNCSNSQQPFKICADTIFLLKKSIQYQVIPAPSSRQITEIKDLPIGSYVMKFRNSNGYRIAMNIDLHAGENNFCITADTTKINTSYTLSNLKKADTVFVQFQSSGCFHNFQSVITITRSSGLLLTELKNNDHKTQMGKSSTLSESVFSISTILSGS